ncbi:hypothetical protein CRENBAI_012656 [Crenichthys baileyi]|uniref:Uncharacterized protein n=1 Tax=Crenichthys baileyi TaxID=28760 RepID=A0AAV9SBS6_9TELE
MDNQQKRNLTFLTIGLIFMLSGIEYAVILPTIWRYLQILEAPPYFLGLGLSAFSLSALLTGIGAGAGSSIFGFLTRSTLPEERAGIFAAIMACRQAGLLVGPAFNLFLRLCDFKLGPFAVNKYTSPGIFMCVLWLLLQFVVLATYWEIPPISSEEGVTVLELKQQEEKEEEVPLMGSDEEAVRTYSAVNSDQFETSTLSETAHEASNPFKNFSVSRGARKVLDRNPLRKEGKVGCDRKVTTMEDTQDRRYSNFFTLLIREFLREEVVVLLTAQFITLFNQTALETMVTPLTQNYFSFGELGNSLMYSLCGVEVIVGFFFVRWLSSKVADRVVLAVGLVICCTACIWCLIFLCKPQGGYEWQLSAFIVGVFLQLLGLPFVAVSQVSLFSKVTAEKTQGFSQGVRRSVGGLATILGPLWAGGLTNNLYIMLGMMLALLVMITVMTVLSYDRLAEPRVVQCAQSSDSGG